MKVVSRLKVHIPGTVFSVLLDKVVDGEYKVVVEAIPPDTSDPRPSYRYVNIEKIQQAEVLVREWAMRHNITVVKAP
jgi:hypothetical protein